MGLLNAVRKIATGCKGFFRKFMQLICHLPNLPQELFFRMLQFPARMLDFAREGDHFLVQCVVPVAVLVKVVAKALGFLLKGMCQVFKGLDGRLTFGGALFMQFVQPVNLLRQGMAKQVVAVLVQLEFEAFLSMLELAAVGLQHAEPFAQNADALI